MHRHHFWKLVFPSLCPTAIQRCCFHLSALSNASLLKKLRKQQDRENTVFDYASKNPNNTKRVYVWGYAATGALGMPNFLMPENNQKPRESQYYPFRLKYFDLNKMKVKKVASGYGFSLFSAIDADSNQLLFGCGINTDSQIGVHSEDGKIYDYILKPSPVMLPLKLPTKTRITSLAAGRAHSVIATDNEGVFTYGNNAAGQCGRQIVEGEDFRANFTVNRLNLPEIKQVVCGFDHTLFLSKDGAVFSCGLGTDGQTGQGHYNATQQPVLVKGDLEGVKVKQIATKADTCLAVSENGELFGWGNSEYGQLNIATSSYETQVFLPRHLPYKDIGNVTVAATSGTSCTIVNEKGDVYIWGYGLLGKGPKLVQTSTPQQIPPRLFGRNEFSENTKITNISAGLRTYFATTDFGAVYVWGSNKYHLCCEKSQKDNYFPIKLPLPAKASEISVGVDHVICLAKGYT